MDGLSEGSHKVIIKHPWNCSEFTPIFSQGPPTPPMPLVPVPFRSPSRSSGPCGHRCLDVLFSFQIHFHRGKKDQLNEGSSSSWEEFLNLKCTLQRGFLDLLVTFHINAPPSALQAPSPPAWFSVNAKCWLGAWRSLHIWGKTELDFLEYPNQPFLKPVGEVPLWWYLDTHVTWPSGQKDSSTWRSNLEDVRKTNMLCSSWEWCYISH